MREGEAGWLVQSLWDPTGLQPEKAARAAEDAWAGRGVCRDRKRLGLCPPEAVPASGSSSQGCTDNVTIEGHQRWASPCSEAFQLPRGPRPPAPTPPAATHSSPHVWSSILPAWTSHGRKEKRNSIASWIFVRGQALFCAFLKIDLAVPGLSCGTQHLQSSPWYVKCFSGAVWTLLSWGVWDPVPWPGIKPGSPALGAQSFSHRTTRKVMSCTFYYLCGDEINVTVTSIIIMLMNIPIIKMGKTEAQRAELTSRTKGHNMVARKFKHRSSDPKLWSLPLDNNSP